MLDKSGVYSKGPVKQLDRCQAKAQLDYKDQPFPTSGQLIDLVRCSVTFPCLASLFKAIKHFIAYVTNKEVNKSNITAIVRS